MYYTKVSKSRGISWGRCLPVKVGHPTFTGKHLRKTTF